MKIIIDRVKTQQQQILVQQTFFFSFVSQKKAKTVREGKL